MNRLEKTKAVYELLRDENVLVGMTNEELEDAAAKLVTISEKPHIKLATQIDFNRLPDVEETLNG